MKTMLLRLSLLFLSTTLMISCAELGIPYPGRGGPVAGPGAGNPGRGNAEASVNISASDARRIARDLGLTGMRPLPPGIARNLARGKALPPGIAKQYPPQNMLSRLPTIAGHEWQITGTDLALIDIGTLIVVDILEDVFD